MSLKIKIKLKGNTKDKIIIGEMEELKFSNKINLLSKKYGWKDYMMGGWIAFKILAIAWNCTQSLIRLNIFQSLNLFLQEHILQDLNPTYFEKKDF